jgi:hypothetical protein
MFGRNVDFVSVMLITLVMLGLGWARSLQWNEALDSIRIVDAIRVERCPLPLPREVLSNLSSILHR